MTSSYRGRLEPGMEIGELRSIRSKLMADDVSYLRNLYREEVAFTDHQIGRLLRLLDTGDRPANTVVILTSDHGEEFLTHGWLGHTRSLFDELIRVPLIIRLPLGVQPRALESCRPASARNRPTVLPSQSRLVWPCL